MPIDLHYVDELIQLRTQQHGGGPGAPPLAAGHRVGASVNRSCIVMLSALLQGHVEDVFIDCSRQVLPNLADEPVLDAYRTSFRRWGNPNGENIKRLFQRIGVLNVLDGLSWRNCTNDALINRLNEINQIRNSIAHGQTRLTLNGQFFSLRLERVKRYRNFVENFGGRFSAHARAKVI